MIQAITRGVHSTLSCYSIDIEDTIHSCLGGVGDRVFVVFFSMFSTMGDRVAFVFISVFSALVCLFLYLSMRFLFIGDCMF